MNSNLLNTLQIIFGLLMIGLILLQAKGTGLGSTFGSDFSFYGTKRGAEKILFNLTIILAFLFLLTTVINVIF